MEWQTFLEALHYKLRTGYILRDIKTKKRCESEIMSCMLTNADVRHFLLIWLDEQYKVRDRKSIEKAKQLKDLGNKEFQVKNYASSIRLYTKSAQYAPLDSEDLPIAIANRSASLFYTDKYEDCLNDIELAVSLNYPTKLCYKLYLRAAQCYLKLKKKKLSEEALLKVQDIISKCNDISDAKRESVEKDIAYLKNVASSIENETEDKEVCQNFRMRLPETTYGSNPNFPFASAALEQRYAPDKGRYSVTNRDVKKGDILFVEKPFAFVLLDYEKSNLLCKHCCHLFGEVPVPCRTCLSTAYCSMKCRNEAWLSYHQWECPGSQIGLNQQIGIAHLALKVFLTCSTTLDNKRFNEVQKLMTNVEKLLPEDLLMYSITVSMLTLYLWKYTNFFKVVDLKKSLIDKFSDTSLIPNYDISSEEGKQLFISSLLLRHTLQLICNGHAITKLSLTELENDKVATEQQERIATGIYPSASMMNHSCDPNIINSFYDQYLIVKTIKDIPAGGEILNCYGPHFRRMSTEERQEILKKQYCFICKCEPCTSPELQHFLEKFSALKCPECSGALQNFHSYSMHCLDCGATPVINYGPEIKLAQELFDAAQVCMELEKDADALDKLKQCLSVRRNVLYKYHQDITATLDLIGKVNVILGRWLDSISYLEHGIVGVEERFGSDSIEVANELNKITDICIQYLREETNTGTKQYKNILKKTRRLLDRAKQIMNLNYGPWNGGCQEIDAKKEQLSVILKNFNI